MEKKIEPIYPNSQFKTFCYIKSVITRPNIIVGDYSYYDDNEEGPESFEKHVTHHYDFMGDKLIIGKFVAIARGVEFVMNGANHMLDSYTTYPFEIIDEFKAYLGHLEIAEIVEIRSLAMMFGLAKKRRSSLAFISETAQSSAHVPS